MSTVILGAYELGDRINSSAEVADYLYWKEKLNRDAQAQALIRAFSRKKELFGEATRFGRFHPDYNRAMEEAELAREELESRETVRCFKAAEERLDELLYDISKTIAFAVSETIKVPSNQLQPEGGCSSGNCSSGGSCSGKCG
jgi:cell fate (sporulation/competence/biofilm development) regulator YlbF (YheA/YmcA/DUF963 family)